MEKIIANLSKDVSKLIKSLTPDKTVQDTVISLGEIELQIIDLFINAQEELNNLENK